MMTLEIDNSKRVVTISGVTTENSKALVARLRSRLGPFVTIIAYKAIGVVRVRVDGSVFFGGVVPTVESIVEAF